MNFLAIIPARYASTRLEGKPLVDINGKSMIQRVYERTAEALEHVYVATDDERIVSAVEGFGGNVVLTSSDHTTGTNRCLEALDNIEGSYDAVINVQGDEPLIDPNQILEITSCFDDPNVELATLAAPVKDVEDLMRGIEVFTVLDVNSDAMYFSRSVIPPVKNVEKSDWLEHHNYLKHVGLYGYTAEALRKFANMEPTALEKAESLEQNRWIENGSKIRVAITHYETIPVDTEDDLQRVREILLKSGETS